MSEPHNTLSRTTRLLYQIGIPMAFIALLLSSPRTAISVPFLALPTAALLWLRSRLPPDKQPDLQTLIWTAFLSGTLGVEVVETINAIFSLLLVFGAGMGDDWGGFEKTTADVIDSEDRQKRTKMIWTWQYLIMLLFTSFVIGGILEESMRYFAVSYIRRRRRKALHAFEYIGYAVASAVGCTMRASISVFYTSVQEESAYMTALTLVERIMIVIPAHSLMAVLTAVNMIQRDLQGAQLRIWQVLYPSVFYHGTFDFVVIGISALDGNVGWIHAKKPLRILLVLVLALSMLGILVLHVRKAIRKLQLNA